MGESKEAIERNFKDISDYFNVDKVTLCKMITINPSLVTSSIKYIDNNISETVKTLNIDKDLYKRLCVTNPMLITNKTNK